MRLTLRTLLAHLDRTLDPDDDAAIAAKLRESEFASKLAQRVKACLTSDSLESPSLTATGTADDPNRIGEYLDSVLAPEQVAEVERICLESDAHLAEVAACHQILTLVLAKHAEISPALRSRVYDLGKAAGDPAAANGSYTVAVGVPGSAAGLSETVVSPAGISGSRPPVSAPPVAPVGPDDSGVSNAPSRLKDAGVVAAPGANEPATAGSRLTARDMAEYSPRPSRVMPWLVSLALAAAFLFFAVRAFAPLWDRPPADADRFLTLGETDEAEPVAAVEAADDPQPDADPQPAVDRGAAATPQPATPAAADEGAAAETPDAPPIVAPEVPAVPAQPEPPTTAQPTPPPTPQPVDSPEPASPDRTAAVPPPLPVPPAPAEVTPPETRRAAEADAPDEPIVVTRDGSLVLIREPESDAWMLGRKDEVIILGTEVISPPLYRNQLSLHGEVDLTMVGAGRLRLRTPEAEAGDLELSFGRFLFAAAGEARQVRIRFADTESVLTLPDPESRAAIQVVAHRPPGMDPESENASQRQLHVLAIQGTPKWRSGNRPEVTLETGQLLTLTRGNQVALGDVSSIPEWIDEPVEAAASLDVSAREGLLALLRDGEPVDLSLREAVDFRRAEVAALAARTIVLLDRYDVYFGSEGVFHQVRQKSYWADHFNDIVEAINRGPENAVAVREAIEKMDASNARQTYRLLWLYSDNQLAAGADQTLVEALDHSSMTVRVLAAENLRHITGTTLLFRPENETSVRRSADIKKWEVRLRRGDIRWTAAKD